MRKMNKELKKLFLVLGLYSLADGIFYMFQELWMAENNLSVGTISIVFSLCSVLSVSVIFLSSNLITKDKLKKFSCFLFLGKGITMLLLFLLHGTGYNIPIKFLIMLDYCIDVELWISLYPLITIIKKDDKVYAIKDILYDACYYIGVFLTGILLGKSIGKLEINYNFYIFIACILTFIPFFILRNTNLEKYTKKEEQPKYTNQLKEIIKKIKTDKISKIYLLFVIFGEISYSCLTEMQVLLLANYFHFEEATIANINIILGMASVIVGSVVIAKLTCKNNYVNLFLKFGIRFILYMIAFLLNSKIMMLISLVFIELSSDAFLDITHAPYINRFDSEDQLSFNNLKEMIEYLGTAIGVFLCGITLNLGLRYIFLVSSLFIVFQIAFAFYALYLRNKEIDKENKLS